MNKDKLHRELTILGNQIAGTLKAIMASSVGINTKVGKNTLIDSNLYDSVSFDVHSDVIDIIVNDYIKYVNSGMRKGVWVPIRVLRDWAFRKGITTDNSHIYAIQRSIYNKGIPPRPVLDRFESQIEKVWAEWADNVFIEFTNEIREELWPK